MKSGQRPPVSAAGFQPLDFKQQLEARN